MAGLCAICEAQPAKYKCPVDGVLTCSLACSKTHKGATCAVTTAASPSPERSSSLAAAATVSAADPDPAFAAQGLNMEETPPAEEHPDFHRLASSRQLQELFKRSPSLRDGLQGIYQLCLEENWMETIRALESSRGRYKGPQKTRHLGRWTEEKGFRRGLGKVKKIRNNNDRSNTFDQAAFGEFCRLVLGQQPLSHD